MAESMKLEELKFYKEKRKYLRSKVTKKCNQIGDDISNLNLPKCREEVEGLKLLREKLDKINDVITKGLWIQETNSESRNQEWEQCEQYDETIIKTIQGLETKIKSLEVSPQVRSLPALVTGEATRIGNQLKLPQLPLPEYSHSDGESLERFFTNFEAVIDKYSLSGYEKFIFLQRQLKNEPLTLIKSLQGSDQSYEEAKALLTKAFASKLTQKYELIKRLSELKLTYSGDPYFFISEMKIITQSFESLNIDVNTVLQYFIWQSMNDSLRSQFVAITNCNKPSLEQINENLFEAIERYQIVTKKFADKKSSKSTTNETTGLAANVNYKESSKVSKYKPCNLCNTKEKPADHPIYKCTVYSSAQQKVDKLKTLGACLKCANSHPTAECRFRFNRSCFNCSELHFSFLCTSDSSKGRSDSKPVAVKDSKKGVSEKASQNIKKNVVNSSTVMVDSEVMNSSLNSVTILPTISAELNNGEKIRILKDSGSQSNFIITSLANRLNCRTVKTDLNITINGFNTSKEYKTSAVEVDMFVCGKQCKLTAICVPTINTILKLEGLQEIVNDLLIKGYKLADDFLEDGGDVVDNISFILGAISGHCIPQKTLVFGDNEEKSCIADTPGGVMLMGTVSTYKLNLPCLPKLNCSEFNNNLSISAQVTCPLSVQPSGGPTIPQVERGVAADSPRVSPHMSQVEVGAAADSPIINPGLPGENISIDLDKNPLPDSPVISVRFSVLNEKGDINESELKKATDEILSESCSGNLNEMCSGYLNREGSQFNESSVEIHDMMLSFVLDETTRDDDGRLIMPLMWNSQTSHLLGSNFNLSKQILKSNLSKLQKNEKHLLMVDEVFKEQEKKGVISRIPNLSQFMEEHPEASFLAHMPVFKPDRDTTKCRVVFLSNLCEKNPSKPLTLNHNQTILPGPCMNRKISTSLMQLRFDKFLLIFDLVKAFLSIKLYPIDQTKLCFLWYRNISKGDYTIVAFKCVRLPFGLRCSPTMLMLALYLILIINVDKDTDEIVDLKRNIYNLLYMDNGALTYNDPGELKWAFDMLNSIFNPYQFYLQQFQSNEPSVISAIDKLSETESPDNTEVLGMVWHRGDDSLSTRKLVLDATASTKRTILSSIAGNFDIFNLCGPLLNRARLFMHDLQCQSELGWDTKLSVEQLRTWKNICKQVNSSPTIAIDRFVGKRDDEYSLIAFTDSSKQIFGIVLFLLNHRTGKLAFLLAKNKLINKQLENKTIPSLELQAVTFGVEVLFDTYRELTGVDCVVPVKISSMFIYTDSLVVLSWLNAYINKLDKMRNRSIFVMNRINNIVKMCADFPVQFKFCAGNENPADSITRALSYKQLMKSNYFTGPDIDLMNKVEHTDIPTVVIPNPLTDVTKPEMNITQSVALARENPNYDEHLFDIQRCSSFNKVVTIYENVLKFVNNLKRKLKIKFPNKYAAKLECYNSESLRTEAYRQTILRDQSVHFPEIFEYFKSKDRNLKDLPNLVGQLNLFRDEQGILRVKCKLRRWKDKIFTYPILLSKSSFLSELLIVGLHRKINHSGCYSVLSELRQEFWITHVFSLVKKVLRKCVHCRRFNRNVVKLNQSPYRDFRLNPANVPFRFVFIDYIGPYQVERNDNKVKVYLLCVTCLWSRAVNLELCDDMTVSNFIRAFQLHTFKYGVPERCLSDLGSNIVAGANVITDFIKDIETQNYFRDCGVKSVKFEQYFKGCNELGSLVESCVKLVKRLIFGALRNTILCYSDFWFIINHTIHLVNRRPIAFKESLRDNCASSTIPSPITPEILMKGHELVSLNLIPELQSNVDDDPNWSPTGEAVDHVRDSYYKLNKARKCLIELYNSEFLAGLIHQATNKTDRYKPVNHDALKVNDVVLIKEPLLKPANYPMGIVKQVITNDLQEVTGAIIRKGSTGEEIKRHASSIIPLLTAEEAGVVQNNDPIPDSSCTASGERKTLPRRRTAEQSRAQTKKLARQGRL